jgi:TPR repeat protein
MRSRLVIGVPSHHVVVPSSCVIPMHIWRVATATLSSRCRGSNGSFFATSSSSKSSLWSLSKKTSSAATSTTPTPSTPINNDNDGNEDSNSDINNDGDEKPVIRPLPPRLLKQIQTLKSKAVIDNNDINNIASHITASEANHQLGELHLLSNQGDAALKYWKRAATQAQRTLELVNDQGIRGNSTNIGMAVALATDANLWLGLMYWRGLAGISLDRSRALQYLRTAGSMTVPPKASRESIGRIFRSRAEAAYILGVCCAQDKLIVPPSLADSVASLSQNNNDTKEQKTKTAIPTTSPESINMITACYWWRIAAQPQPPSLSSTSPSKSSREQMDDVIKAASTKASFSDAASSGSSRWLGHVESQYCLATISEDQIFRNGSDDKKNINNNSKQSGSNNTPSELSSSMVSANDAFGFYASAATQGHLKAMVRVARLLLDGNYGAPSKLPQVAELWLLAAAKLKCAEAMQLLCQCYLGRWGISQDIFKSQHWQSQLTNMYNEAQRQQRLRERRNNES